MNLQTHHSGQISGQVPNQAGTMLPGLPQQNGNPMQNPSIHRSVLNTDPEYVKTRRYMQEKIWEFLMQRRQQSHEVPTKKMIDLVKRLEEALFKSATTTEEYLNLATLESRLHVLIKRLPMSNHNQQFSHANPSMSIGTMIPTPGLQQTGNSSLAGTPSVDSSLVVNNSSNTIASSTANSGNFLPTGNGSSGNIHGRSFSSSDRRSFGRWISALIFCFLSQFWGNNMITSMGGQRMTSQMIPTPGFSSSSNNDVNNNADNQSFMNMESSSNVGAFPAAESSIVSQPMQQKQHVGGQNSRILHNIGGHMGGEIRSTLQQKSYGLSNGPLNGGLGMMGNNMSMMNGPGTTEGYLSGTMYGNSTKPLHQHFDQHQRPIMQGDGYGMGAADASGSGNLYASVTSVGSMMNNQSLNAISMQSMPKTTSPLMIDNQSSVHAAQLVRTMKPQPIDQSDKVNYQPQYSVRENLVQPHQHQQFQQPSHQFQRQHLVQHQVPQRQQTPNQVFLKNDTFGQSQLSSNIVSDAKSAHGTEHRDEVLHSQVSDPFQFSDMQSQFQQNPMETGQGYSVASSWSTGLSSSLTQTSDQMQQLLHPQQFVGNPQSDFGGLPSGMQPDEALRGQWYSKSQDVSHVSGRLPHDQNVQDEFHHRLTGQDGAQLNNLSSEESVIGQSDAPRSAEAPNTSNACSYPRCCATRVLVNHHRRCRDGSCPVCIPVKNYVQQAQLKALARPDFSSGLPGSVNGSCKSYENTEIAGRSTPKTSQMIAETPEDLQPSIKRMKIEQGAQSAVSESEASFTEVHYK
ncbi:UNVERIFIED_CONTAM: Histone acetyltransferase HAC1 [Sesamum radiatum]|uniref:histone acetyltransferase n=1 Tax=Sesamum radiatum TaxID=300843 RepID=A0AAW2LL94_SESRA